jgi:hemerythrin-like metal-binding protein
MATQRAWDEGIGTGVGAMDTEHRLQVSLVNALEQVLRQRQEHELATKTFAQLVDFTSVHFHSEELMMRLYAYPQLDVHSAAHGKLLDQVRAIMERYDREDPSESLELIAELRGWLVNHIKSMDHAFATWLAKNGIRPQASP